MQECHDFELVRELGRGGSAVAHLVRRPATGELLARKILQSTHRDRFEREIAILSTLDHPQIARIRYANLADTPPSLFLDFVDGETLESLHHRLPFVLPEVSVLIIAELLTALEYAHGRGVIHRDLKPPNIILDPSGRIVLVDFGLAVAHDLTRMTHNTGVVGTFDYLAPEQLSGDRVTAQTDIYSVGVILYYLVTGTLPFSRHSVAATLNAIQNDSIEPAFRRNPKVSRELWILIDKALQRRPENRFFSAAEMATALKGYLAAIGFTSEGWTLGNWIESPSAAIMERLEVCADHLAATAERMAKSRRPAEFSQAIAHLSLKAPQSPAIDRLMKVFELTSRHRTRRQVEFGTALSLVVLLVLVFVWGFRRRERLSHLPPELAEAVVIPPSRAALLKEKIIMPHAQKVAPTPHYGRVSFKVPDGTRIFWDGRLIDPTTDLNRESLGSHWLLLEKEGADPIRAEVKVVEREPTVIQVGRP